MAEPIRMRGRADLGITSITVDLDRRPDVAAGIARALDHDLPTPANPTGGDPVAIWRGPTEMLLAGARPAIEAMIPRLAEALADAPHFLESDDAGFTPIELTGAGLHALLPLPGCPAPGPRLSATTRLADLRVTMLRHEGEEQRLWLIAERSSADYLRAWLARRIDIAASAPLRP